MKVSFENLVNEKKIEAVEKEEFSSEAAEKDLKSANNSFNAEDYDWAITIAYNAVLRASRSFMQSLGYRSIGKEHHKNVFEFLREANFNLELSDYFDNIRKQRNSFVYGIAEGSSKEQAEEVLSKAEDFVHKIRTKQKQTLNTQTKAKQP